MAEILGVIRYEESQMKFEVPSTAGMLDKAYELVGFELPPELSVEEKSRLAVEVYKSWLLAESQGRIATAIAELTTHLEACVPSRNNG
jgi:hypothetical protein